MNILAAMLLTLSSAILFIFALIAYFDKDNAKAAFFMSFSVLMTLFSDHHYREHKEQKRKEKHERPDLD